jgi:hypothetical protein
VARPVKPCNAPFSDLEAIEPYNWTDGATEWKYVFQRAKLNVLKREVEAAIHAAP